MILIRVKSLNISLKINFRVKVKTLLTPHWNQWKTFLILCENCVKKITTNIFRVLGLKNANITRNASWKRFVRCRERELLGWSENFKLLSQIHGNNEFLANFHRENQAFSLWILSKINKYLENFYNNWFDWTSSVWRIFTLSLSLSLHNSSFSAAFLHTNAGVRHSQVAIKNPCYYPFSVPELFVIEFFKFV